jgi:hypothetical protein
VVPRGRETVRKGALRLLGVSGGWRSLAAGGLVRGVSSEASLGLTILDRVRSQRASGNRARAK